MPFQKVYATITDEIIEHYSIFELISEQNLNLMRNLEKVFFSEFDFVWHQVDSGYIYGSRAVVV